MNASLCAQRRQQILDHMQPDSAALFCAGLLQQKTWDQDFPFSVNRNFYYLTGLDAPEYRLLLVKTGYRARQYLFIPRPSAHQTLYFGAGASPQDLAREGGYDAVEYLDRFEWETGRIFSRGPYQKLYMDFSQRQADTPPNLENWLWESLRRAYPWLQMDRLSLPLGEMRRIKHPSEVAAIRAAIDQTAQGIRGILQDLAPGVNERALQARFTYEICKAGSSGNAFQPIVAGGANSNTLHYEDNNQLLADQSLLLLDLGAEYQYYSADISRTFPVSGVFTDQQRYFYETVLLGQKAVEEALCPGLPIDDTVDIARKAMYPRCKEAGVAQTPEDMHQLLPHGVCHYLGLDTHDVGPRDELQAGMVLTIEPGLYLPQLGFGIRIEDDALITDQGCEILSSQIPKQVNEIQALMAAK